MSPIYTIENNFNKDLPLVEIVVAGSPGTGKSTWLNILLYALDKNLKTRPFKTSNKNTTFTRGMDMINNPIKIFD